MYAEVLRLFVCERRSQCESGPKGSLLCCEIQRKRVQKISFCKSKVHGEPRFKSIATDIEFIPVSLNRVIHPSEILSLSADSDSDHTNLGPF